MRTRSLESICGFLPSAFLSNYTYFCFCLDNNMLVFIYFYFRARF
jgi:hypothetical protein